MFTLHRNLSLLLSCRIIRRDRAREKQTREFVLIHIDIYTYIHVFRRWFFRLKFNEVWWKKTILSFSSFDRNFPHCFLHRILDIAKSSGNSSRSQVQENTRIIALPGMGKWEKTTFFPLDDGVAIVDGFFDFAARDPWWYLKNGQYTRARFFRDTELSPASFITHDHITQLSDEHFSFFRINLDADIDAIFYFNDLSNLAIVSLAFSIFFLTLFLGVCESAIFFLDTVVLRFLAGFTFQHSLSLPPWPVSIYDREILLFCVYMSILYSQFANVLVLIRELAVGALSRP